ncbi:tripartite tricarboxylate transporter substrate binding protein [Oceanobacillus sp. FSL W7-1304]|uniref:Bug family tripartite tricarboxylate transporter substrate binding protein n=1 Tax=Oceanobacillus sp. FSL W7-1304 TaxID=2975322 RepID=UPI0030D8181A
MRNKLTYLLLIALSLIVISACSSDENAGASVESYPEKAVTLIVPYAPGGGTDLSARILQPYLEDELGVPVVIENKEGGGGWVGWSELARSEPDGYTIGYMNMPNLIVGYMNPEVNRSENLDSFDFLTNHVVDAGVIAIRPDEDRFSTIEELVEYAKEHEVTVNSSGVGSANHFVGSQLNTQLGTNFKFVQMNGVGEAIPAVLGGHVDVLIAGIGETMANLNSGEFEALAVFGDEEVEQLPGVPTVNAAVGSETDIFLYRPIAAPAGLEPEIMNKLQTALEKAHSNEEHIKQINDLGMVVDSTKGEDLEEQLKSLEVNIDEAKSVFGW